MCYHYSIKAEQKILERRYLATLTDARWNPVNHVDAFTHPLCPVITNTAPQSIELQQWGLLPHWSKERWPDFNTANAQMEGITEKSSWRKPVRERRCLIPATGFFEWRQVGKAKFPYFIACTDQQVFSFAGIWDEWVDVHSGEVVRSFAIVTMPANALMARVHNQKQRMPAILAEADERSWIADVPVEQALRVLKPYPQERMHAYSIDRDFRKFAGDDAVFAPKAYAELPGLDWEDSLF
jgi:putative SOS response-associated peptidase YedK